MAAVNQIAPREAFMLLKNNPQAVFVDARSGMEFLFVGHPEGALSIPWREEPDWEINPYFASQVRRAASINRPVLLICRSGHRSQEAGELLLTEGFTEVFNVMHGFEGDLDGQHQRGNVNGWRHDGLPWEQC